MELWHVWDLLKETSLHVSKNTSFFLKVTTDFRKTSFYLVPYLHVKNIYVGCSIEIPALRPAKPLPPKVSNRGKNNLTLRWNAPADNGSAITHYDLEWDQCKGQWDKLVSDKAKQYKLVHKFLPASHAQFRIRASNSIGTR